MPNDNVDLLPLETVQMTLEVRDCTGLVISDIKPIWTSADPTIATVDATGLVKAQTSGNTEVYVVEKEYRVGGVVDVHVAASQ